jgi:hypothetical protein
MDKQLMRLLQKSKVLFFLTLCLVMTACSVSIPFQASLPSANLQGNQLLTGQTFRLKSGDMIEGQIVAIGSNITLERGSMVSGDITLIGSALDIFGIIKGNINVFAGSAHLEKDAIVQGDINQFFNKTVIDQNAIITGKITSFSYSGLPTAQLSNLATGIAALFQPGRWVFIQLIRTMFIALLALVAVVLFKKPILRVTKEIQSQPVISWGVGIFIFLAVSLVSLILIITICLSPVGLLFLLALMISYIYGWCALGLVIGQLLQRWLQTKWSEELQAFVGALTLGSFIALISLIPCISLILDFMIGCIGLGAVIATQFGIRTPVSNPAPTAPIDVSPPKTEPALASVVQVKSRVRKTKPGKTKK